MKNVDVLRNLFAKKICNELVSKFIYKNFKLQICDIQHFEV